MVNNVKWSTDERVGFAFYILEEHQHLVTKPAKTEQISLISLIDGLLIILFDLPRKTKTIIHKQKFQTEIMNKCIDFAEINSFAHCDGFIKVLGFKLFVFF